LKVDGRKKAPPAYEYSPVPLSFYSSLPDETKHLSFAGAAKGAQVHGGIFLSDLADRPTA
jgi:hypothetical protein